MKNQKKLAVVLLLLSLVFIAGCTGTSSSLGSEEEASDAVTDVAQNVDELGTTLEEISGDLGSSSSP